MQLTPTMSKKKIKRLVGKRQAVKNALRDEIKRINVAEVKIETLNPFNLRFRVKQLIMYMEIV